MSVLDTLNAATPNSRAVKICMDGAAQAEWDAQQELMLLAPAEDEKHGTEENPQPHLTAAVEKLEEIRERKAASEVTFRLQAMDWVARVALQAAHPPRPGNLIDQMRGCNVDTFTAALIRASVVSVTGADGDVTTDIPAATWDALLGRPETAAVPETDEAPAQPAQPAVRGSLSYRQVSELAEAAEAVNDRESSVPPSARSLLASQDSGPSSKQPAPGTSPHGGSEAGSRPGSPTSSTAKKAPRKKGSRSGT